MLIRNLASTYGVDEHRLRQAIQKIQGAGAEITVRNDRIQGPDSKYLISVLKDWRALPTDNRPTIEEHFANLRKPKDGPPAVHRKEQTWQAQIVELEARLKALEERFTRVNKALQHIELVLEDEDADNNIYNILVGHLGAFNTRLTRSEQKWEKLTATLVGALVKFSDDNREMKKILKELIGILSPH